jgi:Domain of unknown function (DU1801)
MLGSSHRIPPAVRPAVQAARRTVKAATHGAEEVPYRSHPPGSSRAMWKLFHYRKDGAYAVGIGTYPTHASLFFLRGRELEDGSGLLEGGGKDMRFIRLHRPADAERPAVKRLVRRAFELGAIAAGRPSAARRPRAPR